MLKNDYFILLHPTKYLSEQHFIKHLVIKQRTGVRALLLKSVWFPPEKSFGSPLIEKAENCQEMLGKKTDFSTTFNEGQSL